MKLLITGGLGFVGSHLCEKYVNEGHIVYSLDDCSNGDIQNVRSLIGKSNFKNIKGDVRNKRLVFELVRDCDVVLHLASMIHTDKSLIEPYLTYTTNIMGTLNILEACRHYDKKIIYASTSEVYGTAQYSPMTETHPLSPDHIYGSSKVGADRLCRAYAKSFDMPVFIIRNFNLYGKNQRDNGYGGAVAIFTRRALQGKPPIVFGSGLQSRDYMHVSDAVRAYDLVLNKAGKDLWGVPINFGTGVDHKIVDIANMICKKVNKISGFRLQPVFSDARPNDVQRLIADISLAKEKLGFVPKVKFEDGLDEYIEWIRNYKGEEWKIT